MDAWIIEVGKLNTSNLKLEPTLQVLHIWHSLSSFSSCHMVRLPQDKGKQISRLPLYEFHFDKIKIKWERKQSFYSSFAAAAPSHDTYAVCFFAMYAYIDCTWFTFCSDDLFTCVKKWILRFWKCRSYKNLENQKNQKGRKWSEKGAQNQKFSEK